MNIKQNIKLFIPEIFFILISFISSILKKNQLFDGYDQLFKQNISVKTIYGEYGCGKSTMFVMKNYKIPIYSVDTSKFWIDKIQKENNSILNIKHIDLGEIGNWGRPKGYEYRSSFLDYTHWIWKQKSKPNLVLIDGRFRVSCFLTSLKFGDEGTKIIFDDYTNRRHYHIVEEFLKPIQFNERQALFIVPNKSTLDIKKIELEINKFSYVMD